MNHDNANDPLVEEITITAPEAENDAARTAVVTMLHAAAQSAHAAERRVMPNSTSKNGPLVDSLLPSEFIESVTPKLDERRKRSQRRNSDRELATSERELELARAALERTNTMLRCLRGVAARYAVPEHGPGGEFFTFTLTLAKEFLDRKENQPHKNR